MADRTPEIVEPSIVASDFIDGLHDAYVGGNGCARIVWYREERCVHDGVTRRVVQARMIMPFGVMLAAASMMSAAAKVPAQLDPERNPRLRELN